MRIIVSGVSRVSGVFGVFGVLGFFVLSLTIPNLSYASRARVLVLGTGDAGTILGTSGNSGSFTHDDIYNVFWNPSYIVDHDDWILIERSNFPGTSAQGGFKTSFINFGFGFFFNRVGDLAQTGYTNAALMRPIEFYLGADMGFKWGISFSTGSYSDLTGNSSESTLKIGAQVADFDPFFIFQINGSEPGVSHDYLAFGTRYQWGEWIPFAAYSNRKTGGITSHSYGGGLARSITFGEGGKAWMSLGFWRNTALGRSVLPINLAVEASVLEWLSFRGGVEYHSLDRTNQSDPAADPTIARIGASIHVGPVDLDWAVGFADNANSGFEGTGNPANSSKSTLDSQLFGIGDGFFSAASLTAKW